MLVSKERGNRRTQRKPLGAEYRTNKLNPHDAGCGNRTRATLMLGECCHHCAIPASPSSQKLLAHQAAFFVWCSWQIQREDVKLACAGWNETFRRNDAEISDCQAFTLFEGIHVQYSDTMRFTVLTIDITKCHKVAVLHALQNRYRFIKD